MTRAQLDLFQADTTLPQGLRYQPELISPAEEARLLEAIADLPFKPFEFHGYLGKRRVVAFGWRYDYSARAVGEAAPIPDFLLPLRERVAAFAELPAAELRQAMVTEYAPGAGIGWHRDKPMFGEVIGVSLLSSCNLRFRRASGDGWERRGLNPAPRSAYLLQGPARSEWQHSIPGVASRRYSVTFRRYLGH
ncbi:MAG TPA: alpha-ketoglutarate-dependent dioxygenase AlkB [Caulobacteraceae bacterium]|jgi:alkylated DNA repair dioxygenase AlkB